MDLTEAEGVADLIHAETDAQRRQAYRQMNGALSQKYSDWRQRLLKVSLIPLDGTKQRERIEIIAPVQ